MSSHAPVFILADSPAGSWVGAPLTARMTVGAAGGRKNNVAGYPPPPLRPPPVAG